MFVSISSEFDSLVAASLDVQYTDLIGIPANKPGFSIKKIKDKKLLHSLPKWSSCQSDESDTSFLTMNVSSFTTSLGSQITNSLAPDDAQMKKDVDDSAAPSEHITDLAPISFSSWEDKIIWDHGDSTAKSRIGTLKPSRIVNANLVSEDWLTNIVWDDEDKPNLQMAIRNLSQPHFSEMDPSLLLERVSSAQTPIPTAPTLKQSMKKHQVEVMPTVLDRVNKEDSFAPFLGPLIDRFNISNDRYYLSKDSRYSLVSCFSHGKVELRHSLPALKLSGPHYKTSLSKSDLRHFHRPSFKFPINERVVCSSVRAQEISLQKGDSSHLIPRLLKDLSLADSSPFYLIEYSEEFPPLLSKHGMSSLIRYYYRKRNPKDFCNDEPEEGTLESLEYSDPSPFLGFGDVQPGQCLPVLSNNLFKAPLFRHSPSTDSDFLLISSSAKGVRTYILREIPAIFVVGQTLPLQEVYGPQSRKATIYCKNRVEVAFYRQYNKKDNELKQISLDKSQKMFPQYSEPIMRKWLKDQSELVRSGREEGCWKLLPSAPNLTEEELRVMMTPEMVCCYESMLAGKQRLLDAGFFANIEDQLQDEATLETGEMSTVDDEIKLAPWHVTHNFLLASQGKALLELHGPGDPTGCGQGFSFIRIPLKSTFHKRWMDVSQKELVQTGKYSLAQQQQVYREEIMRIWDAQYSSLVSTTGPSAEELEHLAAENDEEVTVDPQESKSVLSMSSQQTGVAMSTSSHVYMEPFDDHLSSVSSGIGRSPSVKENEGSQILEITREFRGHDGQIFHEIEYVSDPLVISSYLKHRKDLKNFVGNRESTSFYQHQPKKPRIDFETADLGNNPSKVVTCSRCGQLGHMKTNRACPMYSEPFVKFLEETEISPLKMEFSQPKKDPLAKKKRLAYNNALSELSQELKSVCMALFKIPNSSPFHVPVSLKDVPDYLLHVREPMDLKTLLKLIVSKEFSSVSGFLDKLSLIYENCLAYNGAAHSFTAVARLISDEGRRLVELKAELLQHLEDIIVTNS